MNPRRTRTAEVSTDESGAGAVLQVTVRQCAWPPPPNRTSRHHLVIRTAEKMARRGPGVSARAEALLRKYEPRLAEHRESIRRYGVDPPEISEWQRREA